MTTRREYLAAFAALTGLSGCTTMSEEDAEEIIDEWSHISKGWPDVHRGVDREAGVVLYVSAEGAGLGITSVNLSDTELE